MLSKIKERTLKLLRLYRIFYIECKEMFLLTNTTFVFMKSCFDRAKFGGSGRDDLGFSFEPEF